MQQAIHDATAKFCDDIEQKPPDELKDPQPHRRFARLLAIAAAVALLVAAIVVMALRIPKLQSEKKTLSPDPSQEVNKLLSEAVSDGHNINCPCENQVISWCNVTTFHIYIAKQGASAPNKSRTIDLKEDQGGDFLPTLCHSSVDHEKEEICKQILSPVLNSEDSRTFLPTSSAFPTPSLLYKEIALRLDTNAYEQLNLYSLLDIINNTQYLNYSKGLAELVREMQYQFLRNSSSSSEDYWNAENAIRTDYNLSLSFGMDVSWETYLKTCKPTFCDVEYEVSALNRMLRATAQVGGVLTIITLALKFLIWPSIRTALRFPTSKAPAAPPSN